MISVVVTMECLDRLGILKYFPTKPTVVAQVGKFLGELCASEEEARKLTDAVLQRWSEWNGPARLRELYGAEVNHKRYFDPASITSAGPR